MYFFQRIKVSINVNDRISKYGVSYDNSSSFLKWFTREPPFDATIKKLIKESFRAGMNVEEVGTEVIRTIAYWSSSAPSTEEPTIEKIRAACSDIVGFHQK